MMKHEQQTNKFRSNIKILSCWAALLTASVVWAESYQEIQKRGMEEYRAKKYEAAAATMEKAAKLAEAPAQKYDSLTHQGLSLGFLQKHEEAAKLFSELLALDDLSEEQKNGAFSNYLHNVYWQRGDKYQEVIDIAEKTLADDQASNSFKTTSAYLGYLSNTALKKYPEAETMGRKLAELHDKGLWHNRGLIYQAAALRNQKKYAEALAVLPDDAIAKMNPHRQGEALLERGDILGESRKFSEAVAEYAKVYEIEGGLSGHNDKAVGLIILTLNNAGQFDEATVWIERIDGISNKYWKSYALLRTAQLLQKQGKLAEAKAKYQAMIANGNWWKAAAERQIAAIDKKSDAWGGEIFPLNCQNGVYHINNGFPASLQLFLKGDWKIFEDPVLVIDLPEAYSCLGMSPFRPSRKKDGHVQWVWEKQTMTEVERDGERFKRYTISLYEYLHPLTEDKSAKLWTNGRLYLKSDWDLKPGTRSIGYWRLDAKGLLNRQEERFELIAMPSLDLKPSGLKNFAVFPLRFNSLTAPDDDIRNQHIAFWKSLTTNCHTFSSFNYQLRAKLYDEKLRKKIDENFEIHSAIFDVRGGCPAYNFRAFSAACAKNKQELPSLITRNGLPSKRIREGYILCPKFVGENMDFWNSYVAFPDMQTQDIRIRHIFFDFEPHWVYECCFCENCIADFKKFAELPVDTSLDKIKKMYSKWYEFKVLQNAKILDTFGKSVREKFPDVQIHICTNLLYNNGRMGYWSGVDIRKADGIPDSFINMRYYSGPQFFNDVAFHSRELKTPSYTLNNPAEIISARGYAGRYTPAMLKQNIIATAALGNKGWGLSPSDVLDGAYLYAIQTAYALVEKAEDYYIESYSNEIALIKPLNSFAQKLEEGERIIGGSYPDFTGIIKKTTHCKSGGYLVTLLNYDEKHNAIVSLSIPELTGSSFMARDLESGKIYTRGKTPIGTAEIQKGFPVEIPSNGVTLVEITPNNKLDGFDRTAAIDILAISDKALSQKIPLSQEFNRIYGVLADFIKGENGEVGWGLPDGTIAPSGKNFYKLAGEPLPYTGNQPQVRLECSARKIFINVDNGKIIGWQAPNGYDLLRLCEFDQSGHYFADRGSLDDLFLVTGRGRHINIKFKLAEISIENGNPVAAFASTTFAGDVKLRIEKKLTLLQNGNRINIKYSFKNVSEKSCRFTFFIRATIRPGWAFGNLLEEDGKMFFDTSEGRKMLSPNTGDVGQNLVLSIAARHPAFLIDLQEKQEYRWTSGPVTFCAGQQSRREQITFTPDPQNAPAFRTRWNPGAGCGFDLISKSWDVNPGETKFYEYNIDDLAK